jgi:hypothetical protein
LGDSNRGILFGRLAWWIFCARSVDKIACKVGCIKCPFTKSIRQ